MKGDERLKQQQKNLVNMQGQFEFVYFLYEY